MQAGGDYDLFFEVTDGLANVGPETPSALGELGSSLIKEGISVSTMGLGNDYNEDLLAALSRRREMSGPGRS